MQRFLERLHEYLDEFEMNMEVKKRDLDEKKSYEILNHIDGIDERLADRDRQAKALVLREVLDDYSTRARGMA